MASAIKDNKDQNEIEYILFMGNGDRLSGF